MKNNVTDKKISGIRNILESQLFLPTQFANEMYASGFSPDWDLRQEDLAIVRLGIKHHLRLFGIRTKKIELNIQEKLNQLIKIYQHYIHN